MHIKTMKHLVLALLLLCAALGPSCAQEWLYFPEDANGSYINIGDLDVPGDQLTIEALMTPYDPAAGGMNIVSKHYSPSTVNYLLRPVGFEITTSTGYKVVENPCSLGMDSTFHIAATYDGDSLRFFLNGYPVNSVPCTGNMVLNNYMTAIGNQSALPIEQFHGYLDEVRIWNVARSQADIFTHMFDLPEPTAQPGLLAYYNYEGGYTNLQGNASWNGVLVGGQVSTGSNLLYDGFLDYPDCVVEFMDIPKHAQNRKELIITPNPTTGALSMNAYKGDNATLVLVSTTVGQAVLVKQLNGTSRCELDLTAIPKGVYLVEMRFADGARAVERVVKQ